MKSGASPQQLRAKPQPCLGCCGLLYPLSLAWKPKTPMEPKTLCQTQHQGATSHFSNCQPQCLPPPGTLTNCWVCLKDPPAPANLTEGVPHIPQLSGFAGENIPLFSPPPPTCSILPKALKTGEGGDNLRGCMPVTLCFVMAMFVTPSMFPGSLSHERE